MWIYNLFDSNKSTSIRGSLLILLKTLWLGNWNKNLRNINMCIKAENIKRVVLLLCDVYFVSVMFFIVAVGVILPVCATG